LSVNLGDLILKHKTIEKVLVTGGAGFIGSHLVDCLMREKREVTVLDDFSTGRLQNIEQNMNRIRLLKKDVRDLKAVKDAVKDADAVFHLAAIISVPLSIRKPELVNEVNVKGTLNLLAASINSDVKNFVYISSGAVYGEAEKLPIKEEQPTNPISPYAVSKQAAEHHCKVFHQTYGLKTIRLRLFNVYGPRMQTGSYGGVITQFISRLARNSSPIIYGDGEQTRDFVHVSDVTEACLLSLHDETSAGEVFNIGSGEAVSINQLAQILTEAMEKKHLKPSYTESRVGEIRHSCADISKARQELRYNPRISLKEGLSKQLSS